MPASIQQLIPPPSAKAGLASPSYNAASRGSSSSFLDVLDRARPKAEPKEPPPAKPAESKRAAHAGKSKRSAKARETSEKHDDDVDEADEAEKDEPASAAGQTGAQPEAQACAPKDARVA